MLYIYSQKNHRFKLNKKTEKVGLRRQNCIVPNLDIKITRGRLGKS